jgi:hypothetical protein
VVQSESEQEHAYHERDPRDEFHTLKPGESTDPHPIKVNFTITAKEGEIDVRVEHTNDTLTVTNRSPKSAIGVDFRPR